MQTVPLVVLTLASLLIACQCLPRPTGLGHHGSDTGFSSLCRVLCSRKEVLCPLECSFGDLEMYKRSNKINRERRLGDFSFDDYLFMTLLGRNLDDQN